jgi:uncharacterized pyridoxamine 5'-phosphate oxidase family protein
MKNANYRIIKEDRKIKFAGTDKDSWMTLEIAKKEVDYSKGEMIYEYSQNGNPLFEVL